MKRILAVVTAFEKIKDEKDLTDLKLLDILVSLYKTGVKLGRKARNDEDPPQDTISLD